MTKKILSAVVALTLAGTGVYTHLNQDNSPSYEPRAYETGKQQKWLEASKHMHELRANQETGIVDANDVLAARKQAEALRAQRGTVGLNFTPAGPNNIGGRTRAILVDKDNGMRVYCGGVSGGLFVSDDRGANWRPVNDHAENLAVSCIAQASNGDIYYGTGCDFDSYNGAGGSGQLGAGMYKSTDGGVTFNRLASTVPSPGNSTSPDWASINAVTVDPNNPTRVYACTNRSVKRSNDGGDTWEDIITNTFGNPVGQGQDVLVTQTGRVIASVQGEVWISDSGDEGSFSQLTGTGTPFGSRSDLAMCASDENYVYSFTVDGSGELVGLYGSTDMGTTWELLQGPVSGYWDASSGLFNGQGNYDLAIGVKPDNPEVVFLGGVQFWKYDGSLTRVASEFGPDEEYTIHSDKHVVVFDPNNPDIVYVGTDGGIDISLDGGHTYYNANNGLTTTQYYGVGYDNDGKIMGGTQDNGTIEVDFIVQNAFQEDGNEGYQVRGGDGYDCDYSNMTNIRFASIYFQDYGRGVDGGGFAQICGNGGPVCGQGSFYTVARLWESKNDPTSKDSITFENVNAPQGIQKGDGNKKTFNSLFDLAQNSAKVVQGSVKIYFGTPGTSGYVAVSDSATAGVLSGDGAGSVDYTAGTFTVTFDVPPTSTQTVWAIYETRYNAGNTIVLSSGTNFLPINYTLPANLEPGDELVVQDPIQSIFAAGNGSTGVSISRDALDLTDLPSWINISVPGGTPRAIEFSSDGNHMFVASGGSIARVSGLNDVYRQADVAGLDIQQLGTFNQVVTGIAVDPNDPDNVVITLGNYGNNNYVYRATNATTANSTSGNFTSIQGNLPAMPVYDGIISKFDQGTCVIGTELGVWATDDVFASNVTWSAETETMANCQVFVVRQQTYDYDITSRGGELFIGTHGRGMWKSSTLQTGVEDFNDFVSKEWMNEVKVFPNPMTTEGKVSFNLNEETTITANVYDLNGRLVYTVPSQAYTSGANVISFEATGLNAGTYFMSLESNTNKKLAKFVVM